MTKKIIGLTIIALLGLGCDDDVQYRSGIEQDQPQDAGDSGEDARTQADTAPVEDVELPPEDTAPVEDVPAPIDAGGPVAPVTLTFVNEGPLPTYVEPVYRGEETYLGISIHDRNGERMALGQGCRVVCDGLCNPIQCEAPTPQLRQLLPGEPHTITWDGTWHQINACTTENGGSAECTVERRAPPGAYIARLCHSPLFISPESGTRRSLDDTLTIAFPGSPDCIDLDFELGPVPDEARLTYRVELPEPKSPGYCGQAWSYDRNLFPFFTANGVEATEGSSTLLEVGAGDRPTGPCVARAGMRMSITDGREIGLTGKGFLGDRFCDPGDEIYGFVIPPLSPGAWTAWIATMINFQPPPLTFEVAACPECQSCPDAPEAGLGESCEADCWCGTPGAFCHEGACRLTCLTHEDCPGDFACDRGDGPVAESGTCRFQTEEMCNEEADCPKGWFCESDSDALSRCRRSFDVRGLDRGRGFHCGCDAECPGTQSCVRFDFNFTEGFCALPCRDARDCPDDWTCLPETSSGLESICVP